MKQTRKLYFLRDSVENLFYDGRGSTLVSFEVALPIVTIKAVNNMLKSVIASWNFNKDYYFSGPSWWREKESVWLAAKQEAVNRRKDLKNWGIEILELELEFDEKCYNIIEVE